MLSRSKIYTVILVSILAIVSTAVVLLVQRYTVASEPVKVGLYYYPWYTQGYGNYHWNDSSEYPKWNVVDTPSLGYYSTQNETVIKQHLDWFEELRVDFLILSWWGIHSYEDNSTKAMFSIAEQENSSVDLAIMVEACNGTNYNFKAICDYIYSTYVTKYPDLYMQVDGLPSLCFYNDVKMTDTQAQRAVIHSDSRFAARIVGHSSYVDWWFAYPCSVDSRELPPVSSRDGVFCVEPRYDDQFLGRDKNSTFDENLTEGLYDKQWEEAVRLAREGEVNYVTIYSWNEYHERSQIEPHIDRNGNDVTSLFFRTKNYIDWIKTGAREAP